MAAIEDKVFKDKVRRNLQKMQDGGASKDKMRSYLKLTTQKTKTLRTTPQPAQEQISSWYQQHPNLFATAKTASDFYRPITEMGGLVGGGVIGTGASPVAGTLAGATGGYTIGVMAADRLDTLLGLMEPVSMTESFKKIPEDMKTGAMYEMGGQVIGKGIGLGAAGLAKLSEKTGLTGFFNRMKEMWPTMSDEGMLLKAKNILTEMRKPSTVTEQTAKETEKLLIEGQIKTQPTHAQKTGSQESALFEQGLSAKDRELTAILKQRDATINKEALQAIEKEFTGKETVGDTVDIVKRHQNQLSKNADEAIWAANQEAAGLTVGKTPQVIGEETHTVLKTTKKGMKTEVDRLYNEIPQNIKVPSSPLRLVVGDVAKDYQKTGGGKNTLPSSVMKQIRKGTAKDNTHTFEQLRDWRSQISEEIRIHSTGANPNLKMVRRLEVLKKGVDDSMDSMETTVAKDQYLKAKDFFIQYLQKFRKGTVGDVLQPGNLSTGNKVAFSDIPARFFQTGKMDAADDLIRAVGQDNAKTLVRDYAKHDLASKSIRNAELKTSVATQWLQKNKTILDKYKLHDEFKQLIQTGQLADDTLKTLNLFNKTTVSKLLNADVGKTIKTLFSGVSKTNSGSVMNNLLNSTPIRGNPTAVKGIQNSFKDFLLKQMENSGVDVLGNPLMSLAKAKTTLADFLPAMKVLYKNEPKKVQSLLNYHKYLEVLSRNKNVSYAGGSTTVEKLGAPQISSVVSNAAQLVAVQMKKGWFFSASKNLFHSLLSQPGKYSRGQIEGLLKEAIYNPEAADIIMAATKTPKLTNMARKRINSHLLKLGIYSYDKLIEKE